MANWKEYTTKTTPEDADEIVIADTKANANKRTPFSGLWNWIANKLATAVISQLETQNKSIIPALNELNSKTSFKMMNYDGKTTIENICRNLPANSRTTIYVPSTFKSDVTGLPDLFDSGCYIDSYKSTAVNYGIHVIYANIGKVAICIENPEEFGKWYYFSLATK